MDGKGEGVETERAEETGEQVLEEEEEGIYMGAYYHIFR